MWWIQGTISATLTVVAVIDKKKTKGSLQWGFHGWTFYLFIFTQTMSFVFVLLTE
jgi:hypothetical protein